MSLRRYRAKRDFKKTSEPQGIRTAKQKEKIFVVQKHHARRLHYDFRLEAEGSLKSWAVPKGPSLDPTQKRLAVQVEDHPLDYANFEGEIPKGEYGAGKVVIWDSGTWVPLKPWREGIKKGRLEFELFGKKLRGRWALIRMNGQTNNTQRNWLLMKMKGSAPKRGVALPRFVEPQLAQLVSAVPQGTQWIHELKFDGYRTLCRINKGEVQFLTRSGLDWTEKYRALVSEAKNIQAENALIDGELVWIDEHGHSDFQGLQQALKEGKSQRFVYYVFDLLFLDGRDLRELSLLQRKRLLKNILPKGKHSKIIYSLDWGGSGQRIYQQACSQGLEGVVSKDAMAPYSSGRSKIWQKTKCSLRQEMVIGGYTESSANRSFRALLMGVYNQDKKLQFIGKVGTGFTESTLIDLYDRLSSLERKNSAFENPPKEHGIHWVAPKLVGEVEYKTWTADKLLRQAAFKGLRLDKKPKDIIFEKPQPQLKIVSGKSIVAGIPISSPERVLYTKHRVSKLDVVKYYEKVAAYMLPYIQNRPLSLVRCQENTNKACFFQKHVNSMSSEGIDSRAISNNEKDDTVLTINSLQGLIGLIQWGAIEIHSWGSTMPAYKNPDVIVLDLDPESSALWPEVVSTAHVIRKFLRELGLESFVKVTGGKGLHIHVPIIPQYSWDEIKDFSKSLMMALVAQQPSKYTVNMSKGKRGGKIFLDYLRNGYGATAIVPYSLRAKKDPSVALPIRWENVTNSLQPNGYTLEKVFALVKRREDPWEGYFSLKQNLDSLDSLRKLGA